VSPRSSAEAAATVFRASRQQRDLAVLGDEAAHE
jgi:hypothetical protein